MEINVLWQQSGVSGTSETRDFWKARSWKGKHCGKGYLFVFSLGISLEGISNRVVSLYYIGNWAEICS